MSERNYLALAKRILNYGETRTDRTGTGTKSIFGASLEWDISDGEVPLLMTKSVAWEKALLELLWMTRGETNLSGLGKAKNIWSPWADEHGELGPVYGFNWRRWGEASPRQKPRQEPAENAGLLGIANSKGASLSSLGKTWYGMIDRCYNPENNSFQWYGKKGVYVVDEWLTFAKFENDVKQLPGYDERVLGRMVLDKDVLGDGYSYGPQSCQWLTDQENIDAKEPNKRITVRSPGGVLHTFTNSEAFCREHGIASGNFCDLWTGNKNAKTRNGGWTLVEVQDLRPPVVDQLTNIVELLKKTPDTRRAVISNWNVPELQNMALEPCPVLFQFSRRGDNYEFLELSVYQRSADLFLGVPFDLFEFAVLCQLVAREVGVYATRLIWNAGDVHIYSDHSRQMLWQLGRPLEAQKPVLEILPGAPGLFDQKLALKDFRLWDYDPYPAISGKVSV